MTIEVLISHMQPAYDKSIVVTLLGTDRKTEGVPMEIKPGMCQKVYVYEGRDILIQEMRGKLTS